jgi:hypothetical protein
MANCTHSFYECVPHFNKKKIMQHIEEIAKIKKYAQLRTMNVINSTFYASIYFFFLSLCRTFIASHKVLWQTINALAKYIKMLHIYTF